MRKIFCTAALLALFGVSPGYGQSSLSENLPAIAGEYTVVDIRASSIVAGPPEDASLTAEIGDKVSFHKSLHWYGDTVCDNWRVMPAENPIDILETEILSDTQIGPYEGQRSTGDKRANDMIDLSCDGDRVAELILVDDRVLIALSPSNARYIILEKPLSADESRAFQTKLKEMKYLEDAISGDWSDQSYAAASSYARRRGAYYLFKRPAITENLLDGLEVLDSDADRHKVLKVVYSGDVSAYFYGDEIELAPQAFGVKRLAFRFKGDNREYNFKPEGAVSDTDWRFEIFSPDGAFVALQQDRFGPIHVVSIAGLKEYLHGRAEADHIVGASLPDSPASVISEMKWNDDASLEYVTTCCGESETHVWVME